MGISSMSVNVGGSTAASTAHITTTAELINTNPGGRVIGDLGGQRWTPHFITSAVVLTFLTIVRGA
jgi:hypothetical protein